MRYELTDFEWAAIRSFLPNKPRGIPRVDDRRVLNGTFWVLRSGAPWRDLPETWSRTTWGLFFEAVRQFALLAQFSSVVPCIICVRAVPGAHVRLGPFLLTVMETSMLSYVMDADLH
jgi:transposase